MRLDSTSMRPFRCLFICALAGAAPVRAVAADAACVNAMEGQGPVSEHVVAKAEAALATKDPAQELIFTRQFARTQAEQGYVDTLLAEALEKQGKIDATKQVFERLLANPYVARAQLDRVHTHLAVFAHLVRDWPTVIRELEPVFNSGCGHVAARGAYALADAYIQQGRGRDALAVLEATPEPSATDQEWWTSVRTELECKIDGAAVCVQYVAEVSRRGGLSDNLLAVMNTLLAPVLALPEARSELDAAIAKGLIDSSGKVVPRPLQLVQHLALRHRTPPEYPDDALQRGQQGFVQLRLIIRPDGTVKDVILLDSAPAKVFDDVAIASARKSEFEPRLENGVPVETDGTYTVLFRISRDRR
jgi:TonB family protein